MKHISDIFFEMYMVPNDLNQRTIASLLNLPQGTFNGFMTKRSEPSLQIYVMLANITNTEVSYWIDKHCEWAKFMAGKISQHIRPRTAFDESLEFTATEVLIFNKEEASHFGHGLNVHHKNKYSKKRRIQTKKARERKPLPIVTLEMQNKLK